MMKKVCFVLGALACLLAIPTAARAQSAIAGVVKDSSGAVLPGVTVEAASDALIEKSKVVVTDGSGLYKIIDLRPGTYVVTFTLTGFQSFKREGLELPSNFTASIDATMKVGAVEESVTVSGASPVVDVQSDNKSQVLARDVLDSVPNAHTIQSVGQLIPGITLTAPDVGGSQAMQQTYFSVHGSGASGTSVLMDGMIINGLQGDGAIQSYLNDAGSQEISYQTGGGGGDSPTGGVRMNLVPREGGNRFSGSTFIGLEDWQSNNFTSFLQSTGVTSVDKINTYRDFDVTEGGPVKKDRLWFFTSGRLFTVDKPIANTIVSDPSLIGQPQASALASAACRVSAGVCPQGVDPQVINSALARLTLQVNSKNKLSAYMDRIHKDRGAAMASGDDQTTTAVHWTSPLYMTNTVKWTSTLSSRLLMEGGFSSNLERYDNLYVPGIEQPVYSPLWFTTVSRVDSSAGTRSVAGPAEVGSYPDRYNLQGSASYVTGSHNVKVGVQDSYGPYNQRYYANGDMIQNYINGAASTVTLYSTSPVFQDKLNAGLGVYAQDAWTLKHLTLNYALRYDYLSEQVTGQPVQQGTFAVIPAFGNIQMPKQTNWSPHVSAVYDLFGNGRTAIRAGWNRFPNAATTGLAGTNDPANGANITNTAAWTDVNGDNVAQYSVTHNAAGQLVGCVYLTPGCEINFATVPANFGSVTFANKVDPNLKRPYYDQINVGISHELLHGFSVTAEWFRTANKDIQAGSTAQPLNSTYLLPAGITDPTQNPNYRLVNVYSPIDGHVVPIYDAASTAIAALAANDNVFTDPNQTSVYNGFDLGFNARLPRGARLFGGTTTERTLTNTCDLGVYNPNLLLYCDQSNLGGGYTIPWKTQIKMTGSYPLPWWGVIVSGSYQGLPGYTEGQTAYTITKATKAVTCPGTSAAAGCAPSGLIDGSQVTSSINALLDPSGVTLTPRTNELDLGIAKRVKIGRVRIDPKLDVFNALNSSDYFSVRSTTLTPIVGPAGVNGAAIPANATGTSFPSFRAPGSTLQGRLLRIGANVTW
jgi:hypothetical protein